MDVVSTRVAKSVGTAKAKRGALQDQVGTSEYTSLGLLGRLSCVVSRCTFVTTSSHLIPRIPPVPIRLLGHLHTHSHGCVPTYLPAPISTVMVMVMVMTV